MNENSKRTGGVAALALAAGLEITRSLTKFMAGIFLSKPSSEEVTALIAVRPGSQETERVHDRNLDREKGVDVVRRERWGTFFVVCAFLVAIAAGILFLIVYWTSANTFLLGLTLTFCLGGVGVGLVSWSHSLMEHKEAIAPREPMASSEDERQLLLADFREGKHDVSRRGLLTWLSAGAVGVFAAIFISGFRSFGTPPVASLYDTIWKRGQRLMKEDGTPVSVDALEPGNTLIVFPEGSIGDEKAQTVLLRVDEQFLHMPTKNADWAPMGYLAYSRVCTHAGCPVGLYQKQSHLLLCPCHQSSFDVLNGAEPTGGPAARALPQLPLYADADGTLRAGGAFTAPPGPGFWGMPR